MKSTSYWFWCRTCRSPAIKCRICRANSCNVCTLGCSECAEDFKNLDINQAPERGQMPERQDGFIVHLVNDKFPVGTEVILGDKKGVIIDSKNDAGDIYIKWDDWSVTTIDGDELYHGKFPEYKFNRFPVGIKLFHKDCQVWGEVVPNFKLPGDICVKWENMEFPVSYDEDALLEVCRRYIDASPPERRQE